MYRTSNFNKNSKIMHSIEKIISILIYIIIIPIIIFNLTIMIKSYINPTEIPDFFGLKSFVIVSESMESTIMKGIEENGKTKYITKGDNNRREDKEHITYEKIEGVYQFKISGFGKIVELLKDKITLIILLIILVLISLVQVRMSKKRLRRKEKRYEYNKKCNSLKYSNKQNK